MVVALGLCLANALFGASSLLNKAEGAGITDLQGRSMMDGRSLHVGLPNLENLTESGTMPSIVDSDPGRNRLRDSVSAARMPPDTAKSPVQWLAKRMGMNLAVFGRSYFSGSPSTFAPVDMLSPPSDYRIAVGDVLDIKVWGSLTVMNRVTVDAAGQIFIPQIGPVSVAGIRYGELNNQIRSAIRRQYKDFDLQATLGRQNSLQVFVTGFARAPGSYTLGGFSTLMNALMACGGPSATGSMRKIELHRGDSLIGVFDLYAFMIKGEKAQDQTLQTGDVIHIPALGGQVAIGKGVLNPSVYEILPGENLQDLLGWAGGIPVGVDRREYSRLRITSDSGFSAEREQFRDSGARVGLADGDIFEFGRVTPRFDNAVVLRGHVRKPGRYPWKPGIRIKDLIPKVSDLIPDHFYDDGNSDQLGANFRGSESERRLDVNWGYAMVERVSLDSLSSNVITFNLWDAMHSEKGDSQLQLKQGDVITIFGSNDVSVPAKHRSIFVRLDGEVQRGGLYRASYGETLKEVLKRAGGVTSDAYLFGSTFVRKSAKESQRENYKAMVLEMKKEFERSSTTILSSATSRDESLLLQNQIQSQRNWLSSLEEFTPDGRISLCLKPSMDLGIDDLPDMPLEDGDVFTVPTAPTIINVFGEVSRQTGLLFETGKDMGDYLEKSGGVGRNADESNVFVVRADGSIVSESDYGFLFWQLPSMTLLPGDVVIVPRKVETIRWVSQLKDWSQIVANFGLSAAAIATLSRGM